MSRLIYVLITCCSAYLIGCGASGTIATQDRDPVERIVGKWEMVEDREHPRHDPPTETIEFTQEGGFVMRMNGEVEMEGSFRVEKDKVILNHNDGHTPMGEPMTIKCLTANSLILTSAAGKDTEFVRK